MVGWTWMLWSISTTLSISCARRSAWNALPVTRRFIVSSKEQAFMVAAIDFSTRWSTFIVEAASSISTSRAGSPFMKMLRTNLMAVASPGVSLTFSRSMPNGDMVSMNRSLPLPLTSVGTRC